MSEISKNIFDAPILSDPDPVRRAQIQMLTPKPKRFYKTVSVVEAEQCFTVRLDGKNALTPARAPIALPTRAAALLVADEFDAQIGTIDPVTMPVMRLVNTAIDGVARETEAVLEDILRFAGSDLICYRADAPEALVERENEAWDPVFDWARDALGARMVLIQGIVYVAQPRSSIEALGSYLRRRMEPFRVASLHLLTSLTGSALLAIALDAGFMKAEDAWSAAHVDEDWQAGQWGQDSEAIARGVMRHRDFMAAIRLLDSLSAA